MANTNLQTFHVHIHPDSNNGSLPPSLWNACVADNRHDAIVAVLQAYDAQEHRPTTVYTLCQGKPGKTGAVVMKHGLEWKQ